MRLRSSWHLLLLGLVGAGVVLAAVLELGPPTSSARTSREVVTAAKGVVQSTVSGTGNVEPGTDVEANFQTSGTLQHLYAKVGDHVVKGQLLASLDPTAAQNTLDQAQASLTSAEDQLTNAEQATVTTSTSQPVAASPVQYVALRPAQTTTATASTTGSTTTTTSVTPTTTTTHDHRAHDDHGGDHHAEPRRGRRRVGVGLVRRVGFDRCVRFVVERIVERVLERGDGRHQGGQHRLRAGLGRRGAGQRHHRRDRAP